MAGTYGPFQPSAPTQGPAQPGSPFNSGFFGGNPLQTQGPNNLASYLSTVSDPNGINQSLGQANQGTQAGSGYNFPAGPPDASGNVIPGGGTPVAPGATNQNPFQTPLGQSFYQDAINNLSSMTIPDQATLQQQANQQAGLKYDPLIQQLQSSLGSAQTNEKNASGQIGTMYDSLGRALAAQIPTITNQFANSEAQSQNQYQTLQSQINNNYQGAKSQQAAELQQLGIQAALPQSTQKLNSDQQYLGNQAGVNGQALQDAMKLMGQGQADWTQRASQIAPQQGANIQANLATQLLNLQNTVNSQIAGYKGQESAAASSLLSQLTNTAQKDYNTNQTNSLNQSYKLAELMKLTNPGAFGIAPKAPTATKYKGVTGVNQYFADNSSTSDPAQMTNDYTGFVGSPAYAQLTGPSGTGAPTLETSFQGLQQYLQQNDPNITPQGLEELYNALAIKYKQF